MRRARAFRAGVVGAALLTPLGSTMIAVALPALGTDLDLAPAQLDLWLVASYLVVSLIGQSPGGALADRIGPRASVLLGTAIHGVGALLGSVTPGLGGLATARILMAAGGAITVPAAMAVVRNGTPAAGRLTAFGSFSGALGLAAAVGPLLGGQLVSWIGWRAIFVASLPVLAVSVVLLAVGWQSSPPIPRLRSRAFDLPGSVLLALGLGPLTLWLARPEMSGATSAVVGAGVLALFAVRELRVAAPVLDLRLYGRAHFAAGSAVAALHNVVMYALLFQLPRLVDGAGPALVGMLGGMLVLSPVGGLLATRVGARAAALAGCGLALAGVALLGGAGAVLPALIALGAGFGLCSAPAQSSAMSAARDDQAGAAAGALSTARYLGGLVGIALLGDAGGLMLRGGYGAVLLLAAGAAMLLPGRPRAASPAGQVRQQSAMAA